MSKQLVYFGHVPLEGAGSGIIVLRHLRRFSDNGWKVHVVADWGQDQTLCRKAGWPVFELSHRKPWWPPLNPDVPLSRAFRAWLWAGETRAQFAGMPVEGVLTYLSAFSDTLSIAAVGYARRYRLSLATLIHDDARCFINHRFLAARAHARRSWVLQHSNKAWFASRELAACYALSPGRIGILPPIPEADTPADFSADTKTPREPPLLVYAGNYWAPQLPTFAHLAAAARSANGRFLAIIKENPEHVAYLHTHGAEWRAPFPQNIEALGYFRQHASAMVVSYAATSAEMPWTRSSFPSKLVEYCHLGLPIVIVAAEDTALVKWARARQFPDVFMPNDSHGIASYVASLRDPAFISQRASVSRSFAISEFDPKAIQRKLEKSLLSST